LKPEIMKRFFLLLLAASNLAAPASAESRPRYGGTLRIAMRAVPVSPDPAALISGPPGILSLMFETLVTVDERGRPQPLLATSWQADPGNQRWRISLRGTVTFDNGAPLDANTVAASLRVANPEWKVIAASDSVIIETPSPAPDLPAELALRRNAVALRNGSKLSGTGPFVISQFEPGRHLVLTANRRYHESPPFIDLVDVTAARNDREQLALLDLNQADAIEVAPENIRRARSDGRDMLTSQPAELLALLFSADAQSESETQARAALEFAIDSSSINDVVLQGAGETSGALLPDWLSGYAFAIPAGRSERAQRERMKPPRPFSWTLACDPSDPVARIVSERILLNARDAGFTLQIISTGTADLQLIRLPLSSLDAHVALRELARSLHLGTPPLAGSSVSDLYSAETALLQSRRVLPLMHLQSAIATRAGIHGLRMRPDGTWDLLNAWIAPEKP
jgi:MarR-like DNA-binding transcriptional regulator SgrR of sgrS sRNA